MPRIRRIRSPARDSFSGRISGTPPATDASKYRSRPRESAASNSSRPWFARSSLFAVTTGLPPAKARRISAAGGLDPAEELAHDVDVRVVHDGDAVGGERGAPGGTSRSRPVSRTATRVTSRRHPARSAISSAWSCSSRITAAPTLPQPSSPTRTMRSLIVRPDPIPARRPSVSRPRHRRTCATAWRACPRPRNRTCDTARPRRCCGGRRRAGSSPRPRRRAQRNASAMSAPPMPRPRWDADTAIPRVATWRVTGCSSRWM